MPALSLNHFNLRTDAEMTRRLRDFYIDIVGMSEGWRPPFPFPGHWLYLGDKPVLHLVEDESARHVRAGRGCALDHIAFTCTGVSAFEQRLLKRGIQYRRVTVPGTTQMQLFIADPAGNGVELNFGGDDA